MNEASLSLLFRVCGVLMFIAAGIFVYQVFTAKQRRNPRLMKASGIFAFVLVAVLLGIILYTAKNDIHIQSVKDAGSATAGEVERARENRIFRDVQLFTGIVVHLVIISVIGVAYLMLWRRAYRLPRNGYTLVHKALLVAGMCIVAGFAVYATYKCITDSEFREQVYLRTYTEYFVGNIFLMLVASMVAAAGLPDEPEAGQKASSS
ncbi:MAG: hypothetical protein JNM68_02420 [Dinghuibacter sp.]|nr:hypothetical protein [Dinghuibacter sp.]